MFYSVAIDGPSGAGKSTISKEVARQLGLIYVDTGAMYRVIGLNALRKNLDTKNTSEIIPSLKDLSIDIKYTDDGLQHMYLNGEDVTRDIRLPEVSMAASNVSAIQEVRAFLMDLQRNFAKSNSVIMDGRDIGTIVLPNAEVKIFLTASAEERAKRRCKELLERQTPQDYQEVLKDINTRDYNDTHRLIAPLKPANDAIILDTSKLNYGESVNAVIKVITEKVF